MSGIHIFNQRAMATNFQVRIADEEKTYAGQAAQAALALLEDLETRLSRFRANSEIAQIAELDLGEKMRLSAPVYACLKIAKAMEQATQGAFSPTATVRHQQGESPAWSLLPMEFSIRCDSGKVQLDLGAIGKGFALDCMGDVLREWSCPAFLLIAGGSSILAGKAPASSKGWSCGLGEDQAAERYWLQNASLSGSGLAVQGQHIFDPRTGGIARRQNRAWALADSAAESDALSTAAMVLDEMEISEVVLPNPNWLVFLEESKGARPVGRRSLPVRA
ncbi:MAG: FAD:protein FMN transferase [Verrucomicrobiota bacterium]